MPHLLLKTKLRVIILFWGDMLLSEIETQLASEGTTATTW